VAQGEMHVCLICHTEPDVWDGGFRSIDYVLPLFLDMLESVRDSRNRSPRVAWCLTAHVMHNRSRVFQELAEAGHEIGIHSHFPSYQDGTLEHNQEINRKHLDDFHLWLPGLCLLATNMGLPNPRVHATWMFAYRDHMTKTLGENGLNIDCSICYGGAHYLSDKSFLLADSLRRKSGKPYRLSEKDHCVEGNSRVVELPVSGGFEDYWEPDEAGKFSHFSPTSSDSEKERQLQMFQSRLNALAPSEIDIFHIHFHLYGFLKPEGFSSERLQRAKALLTAMGQNERVRFSTPSEAVDVWTDCWERR
jgi:hypothetical protein